jgi:hypothetical protein
VVLYIYKYFVVKRKVIKRGEKNRYDGFGQKLAMELRWHYL